MADTLKGRKLYICETAQPDELDKAGYVALTWVQVKGVGSVGETGTKDNIVSYDEMDSDVTPKGKGISNAGDPQIEMSHKPTDAGQIAMRVAGLTKEVYAFKITDGDAVAGYNPTTYYNRAIVGGPSKPNGRQENFNLEVYTLGCVQREITVDPEALSVPAAVANDIPAISGLADASSGLLTAVYPGGWTNSPSGYDYKWQKDTAGDGTPLDIAGQTAVTYGPQAGQTTNRIRVGVRAKNSAGNASGYVYSFWSPATVA